MRAIDCLPRHTKTQRLLREIGSSALSHLSLPAKVIVHLLPEQKLAKTELFVNLCWGQKKTPQSRNFRGGRLGALTSADDALWNKGPSQRRTALDLQKIYGRDSIRLKDRRHIAGKILASEIGCLDRMAYPSRLAA